MLQATHFIEVFTTPGIKHAINGPVNEYKNLERNLKATKNSEALKTIGVWNIKLKPGVIITQPETTES